MSRTGRGVATVRPCPPLKEFPRPRLAPIFPELGKLLLEHVRRIEALVRGQERLQRASRYVHLVRATSKATAHVGDAFIREVRRLPEAHMASLTWDRGLEMAQHARFTAAADVAVYFCDPQSPW